MDNHLAVLSQAMNLRTQRHQVLASNIANADTPYYKARDFSFESAMQNVLAGRSEGVAMTQTTSRHLGGSGAGGAVNLQYRTETQSAVDGNTVDMDVERSQITENAVQYQILAQLISDEFKGMRAAISSTNA